MGEETLGWWGQQWLAWVRSLQAGPVTDGQYRSALRAEGRLTVSRGRLVARVWAGEHRQVTAQIRLKPWTDRQWRTAVEAIAARSDLTQSVLSGYFGPNLAGALAEAGLALFPGEAAVGCSCGNRSGRCRHLNYLVVEAAGQFDANPFLWLEVLGRERASITAELRAARADREGQSRRRQRGPAEPVDPIWFWEGAGPVGGGVDAAGGDPPADPGAFLRTLGPLEWEEPLYLMSAREQVSVDEALGRMVEQVGRDASVWLQGGPRPPGPSPQGSLPGKAVSLPERLLPEVEAVLRGREILCTVEELQDLCPTARALPDAAEALRALQGVCRRLTAPFVVVADRYVGRADALLAGVSFRHVITFEEWLEGRLSADADWVRGLAAAGRPQPPLEAELRRLQPEVGDELWLTPSREGLALRLVRRADRRPWEVLQADLTVGRMLPALMAQLQRDRLPEQEAVAALLAEGAYRDELHPDPIWLLPFLELGIYQDVAARAVTRLPLYWSHGFPRFLYGNWPRDEALRWFQSRLMREGASAGEIEMATACVRWWMRLWPGVQDGPAGGESLGSFLEFLWNVAPREAVSQRVDPARIPSFMELWFATLEERYPAAAGVYAPHRKACQLTGHYADRLSTAPHAGAGRGPVLAWLAEGFRWIGPAHYVAHGSYR